MAIQVNKSTISNPHVQISSKCDISNMQMNFLRKDPAPHAPFEHELAAKRRQDTLVDVLGTIVLGVIIFGLPHVLEFIGTILKMGAPL